MARDERELRDLARPTEILWEEEYRSGGEARFLRLFEQVLDGICQGREPTVVELFGARRIAESTWKFDRLTGDGRIQRDAARAGSRHVARAEYFAEAELRHRMTQLLADDIAEAHAFVRLVRAQVLEPVPHDNMVRIGA